MILKVSISDVLLDPLISWFGRYDLTYRNVQNLQQILNSNIGTLENFLITNHFGSLSNSDITIRLTGVGENGWRQTDDSTYDIMK